MMFALYGCDESAKVPDEPVTEPGLSAAGTVLEIIDVDTYTYIRLNINDTEVWLASNPVWVSEGDVVRFSDAILMKDFHSESLDRTFEDILFVRDVELVGPSDAGTAAKQATPAPATNPHASMQVDPVAASGTVAVERLEGGKTIAEIYAEHEQIEGQEVSMRAKVTKYSPNIMGKNWITLQDGTGTAPDNKLVVTSSWTVAVGDEVIVKGKIKNNVDIGAGYTYKVLLEEASFLQ